jgi:flagellar basal-body rod protein FlgG
MRSLDIGATGMLAQQINVDVISNNIANMNTTGYKQQRAAFVDLFYENMTKPGSTSSDVGTIVPSGIQLGLGVKTGGIYRTHTQGSLQITENSLDLAVRGDGMFQISLPDGTTAYTRDGTFSRNENGQIVTKEGYELDPAITIPDDALSIDVNASGEVLVSTQGTSTQTNLGQIQLARFINESGLEAIGDNLLLETEASGSPSTGTANENGFGAVQQGALETSNVNVVEELTRLISAQRAYEMNSKVITTSDEMLSTVSQMR